jgi:hypothetical protein
MRSYTYAEVEGALAHVFTVEVDQSGAFRGRIKHLQRLGLTPESPGKGKKIAYDVEWVMIWAFCLELSQFGIDPTAIMKIYARAWPSVRTYLVGRYSAIDCCFVLFPKLIGSWHEGSHAAEVLIPKLFEIVPIVQITPNYVRTADNSIGRLALLNLNHLRHRVREALERVTGESVPIDDHIPSPPQDR